MNIDFDPSKIEQMEVEFEECPCCHGEGMVAKKGWYFTCPKCAGTGVMPKAKGGKKCGQVILNKQD